VGALHFHCRLAGDRHSPPDIPWAAKDSQAPRKIPDSWTIFAKTITPIKSHPSEVAIVEAGNIEKGAIARIKVPFRLRVQVHGNWVPANEL
jgi:hypothetical protein